MDSVSRQYPQRNLHGRIVHTLGRRILRGDISPGDALEAGSVMAASRTALREAIRVLAAKGLVEARPKIGTRVTPRESWNLLDPDVMAWQHGAAPSQAFLGKITEVRGVIEPQAAAFAAERADAVALATPAVHVRRDVRGAGSCRRSRDRRLRRRRLPLSFDDFARLRQ